MAVEATDPNNGNRLLIDQTGLFTAPLATSTAGITTGTYVIKAFSLTQTDKFGTAVIRVSQQSTTIGFN